MVVVIVDNFVQLWLSFQYISRHHGPMFGIEAKAKHDSGLQHHAGIASSILLFIPVVI